MDSSQYAQYMEGKTLLQKNQGLGDLEDEKGNVTEANLVDGWTLSFF